MRKDIARSILDATFAYGGRLNDSMLAVREAGDEREFAEYRQKVGRVLEAVFANIVNPIVAEYPDLRPESLNLDLPE